MNLKKPTQMQVYGRRLFFWDLFVATAVALFWAIVFFHSETTSIAVFKDSGALRLSLNPVALSASLWAIWLISLAVAKSWNPVLAGTGMPEYLLVARATLSVLAVLAIASLLFKVDMSRGYVLITLGTGVLALAAHRFTGRKWLIRQRRKGLFVMRTAIVGSVVDVLAMAKTLRDDDFAGFSPVVAVVFADEITDKNRALLAAQGMVAESYFETSKKTLTDYNLQTVIALGSERITAEQIKRIAWALEGTNTSFIVSPSLVDFAGTRIKTIQVGRQQLLNIEIPTFTGVRYLAKKIIDIFGAMLGIIVFALPGLLVALAIWLTDRGPVLFAQQRVGQNGKTFSMLKFRSMRVGADAQHEALKQQAGDNLVNKVMFKDPHDPRITKVGRFIRRWSIDELPQLLNVLIGQMSLVGPRPPLLSEVEAYAPQDSRRLLVKPGLTGLWQVSGRSLLNWDETIRLDLYYVENWSVLGDLLLIARTVRAIFRRGAF